jgi:ankyrin repeat protein
MFKRTLVTFDQAHRAIKRGNLASIRQALDAGMDANLSNKFSWTLLMLAGIEGNTGVGELLIKRGADPNKVNDGGETALSLAAHAGHVRFVELLLDRGASPECQPHGHSLACWVTKTSGLSPKKIATILRIIAGHGAFNGRTRGPCPFCRTSS